MKVQNLEDDKWLKLLIYGEPNSAKTTLALSACLDERTAPVLYINASGNPQVARRMNAKPFVIALEQLAELNTVYDYLAKGQPNSHKFATNLGLTEPFKTVIVDTITELQMLIAKHIVDAKDMPGDVSHVLQLQHYNPLLQSTMKMGKLFFDLPMHIIFVAQETFKPDEETQQELSGPQLVGEARRVIPSYALNVIRMRAKIRLEPRLKSALRNASGYNEAKYIGFLQPTEHFYAKDQLGVGKAYIFDPTVTDMMDTLGW